MTDTTPLLQATQLHRTFREGDTELHILNGVDLHIAKGEFVALLGRSGSGKSTLLHLLAGLDHPTKGTVTFHQNDLTKMSQQARCRWRNQHLGLVFQSYHLLPELTAIQNVLLPSQMGSRWLTWAQKRSELHQRAEALLERVGLKDRLHHKPAKLSGGEKQRVAIARALINNPSLLLADEPTGNLDTHTAEDILEIFSDLHSQGTTLLMVTHDTRVAQRADRIIYLEHGELAAIPES